MIIFSEGKWFAELFCDEDFTLWGVKGPKLAISIGKEKCTLTQTTFNINDMLKYKTNTNSKHSFLKSFKEKNYEGSKRAGV